MEYIEHVKRNNPIIFNTFKNAFENNKISHAYLFSALQEITIEIEPLFLIQILISEDPFNGKLRNVNNYVDLEIIDNKDSIIKKEQITNAIMRIQETPFEKNGKKILYIKNLEKANIQSLNALLKFLEDPTPNTYLIFTTNNLSQILSTIKSRTQIINVQKPNNESIIHKFIENDIEEENARLFANFTSNLKIVNSFKNEINLSKKIILETLEKSLIKKEYFFTKINEILEKNNAKFILNLLNSFFNDIWKQKFGITTSFNRSDLINKYIDIDFDYKLALHETIDFLKNLNFNVNFSLYKNKFLLNIKRLYG